MKARKLLPSFTKLETVQGLRAFAVLMVVISHICHELARMLDKQGISFDEKYFPGDFGVDLFFVISGFIMVYTCWDQFQVKGAASGFIKRRLIRIVPLYWAATTAMILIVSILPGAVNTATNDVGQWVSSYFFWPYAREGDGLIRPVLGLGWSLQYEMFFYLIFAVCLMFPRKIGLEGVVIGLSLFVLYGIVTSNMMEKPSTFVMFASHSVVLEFGFGVMIGAAFCKKITLPKEVGYLLAITGLVALFFVPGFNGSVEAARSFYYGIPAAMILTAFTLSKGLNQIAVPRSIVETGEISYAIYLVHPFVVGASALCFHRLGFVEMLDPVSLVIAYGAVVMAVSGFVSYLTHYLFDLPVSRYLRSKLKEMENRAKINSPQHERVMNKRF